MKSNWITHRGARILHVDLSNFERDLEGLRAEFAAVIELIERQSPNSVLILADLRNTVLSVEATTFMKDSSRRVRPALRKGAAVADLGGFRKVVLDAVTRFVGQNVKVFEDLEEAKDWLARDG